MNFFNDDVLNQRYRQTKHLAFSVRKFVLSPPKQSLIFFCKARRLLIIQWFCRVLSFVYIIVINFSTEVNLFLWTASAGAARNYISRYSNTCFFVFWCKGQILPGNVYSFVLYLLLDNIDSEPWSVDSLIMANPIILAHNTHISSTRAQALYVLY